MRPSIWPQYTAQPLFTVNEAIWWAKFGHENLMAALNRRPERINGLTSVTLITCFIIQWKKRHLVIHERCQWDLGSGRGGEIGQRRASPDRKCSLFFSSRGRQAFVSLALRMCFFLKIGNKRNGLCLRCSDSSSEIRSFFFISFRWRLHHYDENLNKLCSRALQPSDSVFYSRLNNSGQPDASWVWIWTSAFAKSNRTFLFKKKSDWWRFHTAKKSQT